MLGIEGVKMELLLPEDIYLKDELIQGQLRLTSQSNQTVESIEIKIVEKYKRGRGEAKLIDEYLLGSIEMDTHLELDKDEVKLIDFKLPFTKMKSEMDQLEDSNILTGLLVKVAKKLKDVKSTFRIEAKANIKNTKLGPVAIAKLTFD